MRIWPMVFAASLLIVAPAAQAQEAPATDRRAAATMADLAWLEGHWVGTGIGGLPAGESFSYAGENRMIGHFWQLADDGTARFYELITIVPDGDSLTMRLKHFNDDLTGWEEKPGATATEFPLRERSDTRWIFGAASFERPAPDRLEVSVRISRKDGSESVLRFSYRRHDPGD